MSSILCLLVLCGPPPAADVPIAGRFENKIVYGTVQSGIDVTRLREDCSRRGGRFNECGSACAPDAICAQVCAYTCELGEEPAPVEAPESWTRYESEKLRFRIEYPPSLTVDESASAAVFRQREASPAQDALELTVERRELPADRSLKQLAREEGGKEIRAVECGGLEGFAYTALTPVRRERLWLATQDTQDGHGYYLITHTPTGAHVAERMLASFEPLP